MVLNNKKGQNPLKNIKESPKKEEEPPSPEKIEKPEDLVKILKRGCKKISEFKIGLESEKSGIYTDTLTPVQYTGQRGYNTILKKFSEELGWQVTKNERKNIFELQRGDSRLTLESDGRIELSSRPQKTLHDLAREFRIHQNELSEISKIFKIAWLGIGLQPFHSRSKIQYAPKPRHHTILSFFKSKRGGEDYLKKVNGINTNFDYNSEEDAIKKFQVGAKITPIVEAMFVCSPFLNRSVGKFMSHRLSISLNFDPKRTDFRKEFFQKRFSFEQWVDFILQIPMFYIERDEGTIKIPGLTFKKFILNGYKDYKAIFHDFLTHSKTIRTEIRFKADGYIEWRPFDSQPPGLTMSAVALTKGIFYSKKNTFEAIESLVKKWDFPLIMKLRKAAYTKGLAATFNKNEKLLDYAKKLLEIATEGLKNQAVLNAEKEDESIYLEPIKEYVFVKGMSPAEFAVSQWNNGWKKDPQKLIEWCSF